MYPTVKKSNYKHTFPSSEKISLRKGVGCEWKQKTEMMVAAVCDKALNALSSVTFRKGECVFPVAFLEVEIR
jgi:hypothetical protein